MLKDITLGQFFPADSPIHRLDPRVKIMSALAFIIAVFFVDSIPGFVFVALFVICVTKLSKLRISMVVRGVKPILFLVLFTAIINMVMTSGEIVVLFGYPLEWGFLKVTKEGVHNAVMMALRLLFLVTGTSLLTLTTSPILLTDGIERLLSPFRRIGLPAHELAMMMSIALRFIPTLLEETDKIMKAQMARGADFESGNLIKRARALIPILVPLFISSFRRADELATAMECRCYRGGEGRTRLRELVICGRDYGACAVMAGFVVCVIVIALFI